MWWDALSIAKRSKILGRYRPLFRIVTNIKETRKGQDMKKTSLILAVVPGLLMLLTSTAKIVSANCTVGVKDCRPSSPKSTKCYWWECEQTGSETTWIFKGTPCTCPSKKSSLELPTVASEEKCEDQIGKFAITGKQ
jgi:hypothetical protein